MSLVESLNRRTFANVHDRVQFALRNFDALFVDGDLLARHLLAGITNVARRRFVRLLIQLVLYVSSYLSIHSTVLAPWF
jgi:hypothetical protein